MKGITGFTKGNVDLSTPLSVPSDEVWRYEVGYPFQVAPHMAALVCGIIASGTGNIDFVNGGDLILFDDLADIRADEAVPLARNLRTGTSSFTLMGLPLGGFVPFGARLEEDSPHPHAGTGFGLCEARLHSLDGSGHFDYIDIKEKHFELFQFAYAEKGFRVLKKERMELDTLLPGWDIVGGGFPFAIPDGQDLLYVMTAMIGELAVSGVARWRNGVDGWRPISFVPVTGDQARWGEPSLIRDGEGSLLFSARSDCSVLPGIAFDAAVWRSMDNGATWKQIIYRKDCRSRSPVSINRAADGTPYLAANLPPNDRTREVLCYWPLNESRTALEDCVIVRDAPAEFGTAPSGSWWRVDHPVSAVLRLADGAWHSVLAYHIVDNGEIEGSAGPTPQTGCYLEEVFSQGEVIPAWRF
jgi:hypothetical protein